MEGTSVDRLCIAAVLASSNSVKAEYLAWHLESSDFFTPVFKRYASLEEARLDRKDRRKKFTSTKECFSATECTVYCNEGVQSFALCGGAFDKRACAIEAVFGASVGGRAYGLGIFISVSGDD